MPSHSPPSYSHSRRGSGGGRRSPDRRGSGGGRRREQNHGTLLVRNFPFDCRPEELRVPFERFGPVRDVYMPKDYYTGKPRGFAFVQYIDPYDASEAHYRMNGHIFAGREISVVFAVETRKRPEEMRQKARPSSYRRPVDSGGRKPSYHGRSRSRSRSVPRSHFSHHHSRYNSRSFSPAPRRPSDRSLSSRRQAEHPGSPRYFSPAPRRRSDHSLSPRRQAEHPRSPRSFLSLRQRSDYSGSPRRQAEDPPSPRSLSPVPRLQYQYDDTVSPRRKREHPRSRRGPPGEPEHPRSRRDPPGEPEHPRSRRDPPGEPDGDKKRSSYSLDWFSFLSWVDLVFIHSYRAEGNICTSLELHKASGGNCHVEHQDLPLDLDQGQLICHPGIKDEMVGPMLCSLQNDFSSIYQAPK
ncbi:serine/arginine-rich SC35-like splicing factor SCL30 [Senna tora]|uniref:Serine/arginine-rich SC35-like splicing factor SCL30 n=1 Tax=Senna tora TaxID=362788 RepID=A0A834WGQ7_9FABA|nr:serine/arginine-rich SC35-like splicing factor SCL30 [Senna tora]